MGVSIISGLGPAAPVRLRPRPRSGATYEPLEAARSEASTGVLSVGMPSLLALQEAESNEAADQDARGHGQSMLAALAEMQRGLLSGGGGQAALDRLAALARTAPGAADPRLASVQKAIQVRAAVELARAAAVSRAAASV